MLGSAFWLKNSRHEIPFIAQAERRSWRAEVMNAIIRRSYGRQRVVQARNLPILLPRLHEIACEEPGVIAIDMPLVSPDTDWIVEYEVEREPPTFTFWNARVGLISQEWPPWFECAFHVWRQECPKTGRFHRRYGRDSPFHPNQKAGTAFSLSLPNGISYFHTTSEMPSLN